MAAPSKAELEEMIRVAVQTAVADVDVRFGQLLQEQVSHDQTEVALKLVIREANSEFLNNRQRINDLCTGFNLQFEDHRKVIEKIVADFQASTGGLSESTNKARIETETLRDELMSMEERHTKLREDLGTEFSMQKTTIVNVREEMSKWAEQHKVSVMTMLQQGGGGNVTDHGSRSGQSQDAGGKGPSIEKKELSV